MHALVTKLLQHTHSHSDTQSACFSQLFHFGIIFLDVFGDFTPYGRLTGGGLKPVEVADQDVGWRAGWRWDGDCETV